MVVQLIRNQQVRGSNPLVGFVAERNGHKEEKEIKEIKEIKKLTAKNAESAKKLISFFAFFAVKYF